MLVGPRIVVADAYLCDGGSAQQVALTGIWESIAHRVAVVPTK